MPKGQPVFVRISFILSALLLILASAGAAFVSGYGLCFRKFSDAYSDLSILKARAVELEEEILHLKNYAILIDALTTRGNAAKELVKLPCESSSFSRGQDTLPRDEPAR
ncbi:hypothetical protein JXM67_15475 [candidate division WOR-3 bacterium]|nr:hypothetical protein [candidate division WOR-3 bacterium]